MLFLQSSTGNESHPEHLMTEYTHLGLLSAETNVQNLKIYEVPAIFTDSRYHKNEIMHANISCGLACHF